MSVLGLLLEGFDESRHPRGALGRWIATFHHPVHGARSMRVTAGSSAGAFRAAQMAGVGTVLRVQPVDDAARRIVKAEKVGPPQDFQAAVRGNNARAARVTQRAAEIARAGDTTLNRLLGSTPRDPMGQAARELAPVGRPRRKAYLTDPTVHPRDPVERVRRLPR